MMEGLPEGWKLKNLNDVTEIIMGQSPPSNTYNNENIGLPFFQGKAEFGKRHPQIKKFCSNPKKTATKNNMLMSVRAPVGSINISNTDCCIGRGLCAIRCKDKLNFLYLYHYLKANEKSISLKGVGSTFKAISKKDLHNIEIPLPPLPIQKKIADILEKAEKLKTWRAEADKLTDEFLKSKFMEMFGDPSVNSKHWTTKKLREISEIKTGGTPSRKNDDYWQNGDIPWIKTTEIKNNVIYVAQEYITEKGFNQSNVSIIPNNSILIAMYGQGKTRGHVSKLGIDATVNQACAAILPSTKYEPDFMLYFLKSSYKKLRSLGRGGNQPNLNLTMVKNFEVYYPPLPLQQKFAAIVQQVEQMRQYQQESKAHIDDLFNALMQKAFKGELVA